MIHASSVRTRLQATGLVPLSSSFFVRRARLVLAASLLCTGMRGGMRATAVLAPQR